MPDFDQFERLLRQALSGSLSVGESSRAMGALLDDHRPTFAKGKSVPDIEAWLARSKAQLATYFGHDEVYETSNDNRAGKDLFAVRAQRDIELKSPTGRTDANPGVSSLSWAFDDETDRLSEIMRGRISERIEIWLSTDSVETREARIHASKLLQQGELKDYLNDVVEMGHPVRDRLAHFVRSIARGITTLKTIRTTFENPPDKYPLLLVADWEVGLLEYDQAFDDSELIRAESLIAEPERARISLRLRGDRTSQSALIYPHYKNGKTVSGTRVPAHAWVATPCFHVWIVPARSD